MKKTMKDVVKRARVKTTGDETPKIKGVGRPAVMTPCPFCGEEFSAREYRRHVVVCEERPGGGREE